MTKRDRFLQTANASLVSRRSFLNRVALGLGLAPLAAGSLGTALALGQTVPPPTNVRIKRRTLSASDFSYLGAMRLPTSGYPNDEDPSFSYVPLAARKVNGVLRFFMTGSNPKGDRVFEFIDTQSYTADYRNAPRAAMATYWGDVYQGRRKSWDAAGNPVALNFLLTRGLLWHNDRLYWTFYDSYNTVNRDDWCIGMTNLGADPSQIRAYGPWRPTTPGDGPGVKHANQWLVEMPDGTLGAGASIQSGDLYSSYGPELVAGAAFPTDATPSGYGTPNLAFPQCYVQYKNMYGYVNVDGTLRSGQPIWALRREGSYVYHNVNPSVGRIEAQPEIDPAKNGGVGSFTSIDGIGGCVYINLPDKPGILFLGALGTGHVWYGPVSNCGHGLGNPCTGGQGPNATSFQARWWIYDPAACQASITRAVKPWQINPAEDFDPSATIAPM